MGAFMKEEVTTTPPPPQPPRRRLRSCCCGCSLRTGCVIIGTLGLLNGIASLYAGVRGLSPTSSVAFEDDLTTNVISVFHGALQLVVSLSLIYGVDKRKISLLKLWLYVHYVEMAFVIGSVLYLLILNISAPAKLIFFILFSSVIGIGVMAYCIAIVQSLCKEITDEVQRLNEFI